MLPEVQVPNLFPNDEIDRVISDTRPGSLGRHEFWQGAYTAQFHFL